MFLPAHAGLQKQFDHILLHLLRGLVVFHCETVVPANTKHRCPSDPIAWQKWRRRCVTVHAANARFRTASSSAFINASPSLPMYLITAARPALVSLWAST